MRTVILHYHLFKNAGSSLDASFKAWLGDDKWATKEFPGAPKLNQHQLRQWIIDNPQVSCFSSHSAHLPPPQIEGVKILPVIFIRHPIDRIFSAYEFERKQGADTLGSIIARNTTLSGYIEIFLSQPNWNQVGNFHCHRLSRYFELPDKSLVERASMAVDSLPFIGVVEDYSNSIVQLEGYLQENGFSDASLKAVSLNRNNKRLRTLQMRLDEVKNMVSPNVYKGLIEKNQGDFFIYEKITGKPIPLPSKKKYLIQYWSGKLPTQIKSLMDEWQEINGDYEYIRFDEGSAFEFIARHYGAVKAQAFLDISFQAMKSDVFRLAAINILGGVYIDAATKCNKPIITWGADGIDPTFIKKRNGRIANALIIASPGSQLVKILLEQAWEAILDKEDGNIWLQTGPGMLKKVLDNENLPYQLLEQEDEQEHFKFLHDFEHKKSAHWSKQQLYRPIYHNKSNNNILHEIEKFRDVFSEIELDIHIGHHKTGTTSIQSALYELDDSKIIYPKTGLVNFGHHLWADIFANGNYERIIGIIGELADELLNKNVTRVVLSSEYFSSKNEIEFDKKRMVNIWTFLASFSNCFKKSNVIFYARGQASSVESRIRQAIESRLGLQHIAWKKVAENPCLSYASFLEAMRYYFPNSSIEPRSFERAIQCGGVVKDFSSRLGIRLNSTRKNISESDVGFYLKMIEINNLDVPVDVKMERKHALKIEREIVELSVYERLINKFIKQRGVSLGGISGRSLIGNDAKEIINKNFEEENNIFKNEIVN